MKTSSLGEQFNRSVRELNIKNNLASLRLRKELAEYDRARKFHVDNLDRNRVNTYEFLKQLQVCESNLVPAYKELLEGIISQPNLRRRVRKSHTAPSAPTIHDEDAAGEQKQHVFVPKFTKAQVMLLQTRQNIVSNKERADMFLTKLRQIRKEELEEEDEINQYPELAMSRKLSRLISTTPSHRSQDSSRDRWAQPRGSGFYSLEKMGSIASKHRLSEVSEDTLPVQKTFPELVTHKKKVSITSLREEDCFGRPIRKRPLDKRLKEFYEELDTLKRKQEERMVELPIGEKRRRWVFLTKGFGADVAELDFMEDYLERSDYF